MSARTSAAPVLILAVAALLRLHGLCDWSLDGDELYSWYDVQAVRAGEPLPDGVRSYPVGYALMGATVSVLGQSEGTLRLASAVCGILAVGALLVLRRDAVPRRAAWAAGALAALSPWLIYHAQTARFYGPLLLFASMATLWALPGPGRRPLRAAVAWLLAVGCHPTALLLGPALVVDVLRPPVRWRRLAVTAGGFLALAAFLWSDAGASLGTVFERAVSGADPGHYDTLRFVLGLGYAVGPIPLVLVLGGLVSLRHAAPDARWHLPAAALLPGVVLLGVSLAGLSMHQRYAMASVPALLLLAGRGVASLAETRGRLAAGAGLAALLAWSPELAAWYEDGDRHDARAVAASLATHARPTDVFVVEEHATLELYLHEWPGYADTSTHEAPIVEPQRLHTLLRVKQDVWLALKVSQMEGSYEREFVRWVERHFEEVERIGRAPRALVRHDNRYAIFRRTERLPPAPPPTPSTPTGEDG